MSIIAALAVQMADAPAPALTFDQTVVALSPWAYWKLEETTPASGASAPDASGNARNGTYEGSAANGAGVFAARPRSAALRGSTQIRTPGLRITADVGQSGFLSVNLVDATGIKMLISADESGARRWQLRHNGSSLEFVGIMPSVFTIAAPSAFTVGQSAMVGFVYDPALAAADGRLKLYLNGAVVAQSTTAVTLTPIAANFGWIGARSGNDYLMGNVNSAMLFNKAISAAEVAAMWAARDRP